MPTLIKKKTFYPKLNYYKQLLLVAKCEIIINSFIVRLKRFFLLIQETLLHPLT